MASYKKKPPKNKVCRKLYMKTGSDSKVSWYHADTHRWIRYATEEETKNF